MQNEYSLWTRQIELGLLQACERLGTALVAFSPVARGMFADILPDRDAFSPSDFRRNNPRFMDPHFESNKVLIGRFMDFAKGIGEPPASLALAWVLAKGSHVVPIPGTRSVAHLKQHARAAEIKLSEADMQEVAAL